MDCISARLVTGEEQKLFRRSAKSRRAGVKRSMCQMSDLPASCQELREHFRQPRGCVGPVGPAILERLGDFSDAK